MKIIDIKPDQNVEIIKNADGSRCIKIEDRRREKLSELKPGETFKIGEWDFIVLEHLLPGRTAIISKSIIRKNENFGDNRDYKESNIKKIIEQEILPEVEKEVGLENILRCDVELTSVDMQNEFGTVKCKMRPITFDEARKYNNLLVNKHLTDRYWTLTPWSTEERGWEYSIAVVAPSGGINWDYCGYCRGVRPMCYLSDDIEVRI